MPRTSFQRVRAFHTTSAACQALLFGQCEQSFLITSFDANGGTKFQTMFKIFRRALFRFHGEFRQGFAKNRAERLTPHTGSVSDTTGVARPMRKDRGSGGFNISKARRISLQRVAVYRGPSPIVSTKAL